MSLEPNLLSALSKEAERIEEDALFSCKGHYNAVPRWLWAHRILGITAAVASALAGVSALREIRPGLTIISAGLATLASVVLTALKPSEEAARHHRAGDRYLAVRRRVRVLRTIELLAATSPEPVVAEIKAISDELADIRIGAPIIPRHAFAKAKREIETEKTADYAVDQDHKGK